MRGDTMIQTSEGVWQHGDWTITIWHGQRINLWVWRATSKTDHRKGVVQALSEESAAELIEAEL